MQFVPGWTNFNLNMGFLLDVMVSVNGLEHIGFQACFDYAVVAKIEGISIGFLHYNHLITCKRAAGRPRDLSDIEELEENRNATGAINANQFLF